MFNKYYTDDQYKKNEMYLESGMCGEKRNTCRVLVGKPERYRPLERPRSRWENNIKKDRKEIGQEDVDWINYA